jgi:hypothetical protein
VVALLEIPVKYNYSLTYAGVRSVLLHLFVLGSINVIIKSQYCIAIKEVWRKHHIITFASHALLDNS